MEPASASGLETARLEEDLLHSEISDVTRLSHLTSYNKYLYICSNLSINQYFREISSNLREVNVGRKDSPIEREFPECDVRKCRVDRFVGGGAGAGAGAGGDEVRAGVTVAGAGAGAGSTS